jgi:hypothetical protein
MILWAHQNAMARSAAATLIAGQVNPRQTCVAR